MSSLRNLALSVLVVACGGKTNATSDASPAASASSSPSAAPRSSSSSNPGRVTCGSSECDLAAGEACCTKTGAPTCSTTCASWTCDEAADCGPGEVCCATGPGDGRSCAPAPCTVMTSYDYPSTGSMPVEQFCKLATECAAGLTCRLGVCQSP